MTTPDLKLKAKWLDRLSNLPADKRASVLNALYEYFMFGEVPKDSFVAFAIAPICEELKRAKERHAKKHAAEEEAKQEKKPYLTNVEIVNEVMKPENRHIVGKIPEMYDIKRNDFWDFLAQYAAASEERLGNSYFYMTVDDKEKRACEAAIRIARERLLEPAEQQYVFP